jgi:hypothetical protein
MSVEIRGFRHSSGVVQLSGTTPTQLWVVPTNRKARITKIMIYNADTADHVVTLYKVNVADPTDSAQILPSIPVPTGQLKTLTEDEIPDEWVSSTSNTVYMIAAAIDAAVTANNVQIIIEVEEL